MINIFLNARDATKPGDSIRVACKHIAAAPGEEGIPGSVEAGDYALLTVSDTGVGMVPEVAQRAFEPYFTTKPVGKGTGLGLSMVFGIVKQASGHIWIVSEPGTGTTVSMLLPICEQPTAAALE